jgi:Raf kinase inhibitor-like YbhB/YbcL family protein
MEFTSPVIASGGEIPAEFTCEGEDVSPPLHWAGVPEGAAELVLHVRDPDAPGGTFTHWILAGIDPASSGLEQGSVPPGTVEGVNDFGKTGYGGPCPPPGPAHRYVFTLLAVSKPLGLHAGAMIDDVESAAADVTLATAELSATYGR